MEMMARVSMITGREREQVMARSWEEMLSNPIEGEQYQGAICGDCLTSNCHHLNEIKREGASK